MDKHSNIWFPFTQMKTSSPPILIKSGKGTLLFDEKGNNYIDAISSWWTNLHGHAHPYIAEKVFEQHGKLEHVIFAGFTHQPAEELAERLLLILKNHALSKIFYSDNGSTAVEVAIKMALQFWYNQGVKKNKIITFRNGYHGDTFGSMSVSGRNVFTQPFDDLLFDVISVTPPLPGKEAESEREFKEAIAHPGVAAFIYEPLILGAGGMLMYESNFLNHYIQAAKKNNIICIADEVMTGFYRTGKMFASDFVDTSPDLLCLSKGITGGTMALGVTAAAEFIFDAFYSDDKMKTFYHGHSYTANPLACTSALASLYLLDDPGCQLRIKNICIAHESFCTELKKSGNIENIRQQGTIVAFDIKTNSGTGYLNNERDRIETYFIGKGILIRPLGNTIYLMPPYCITEEQLNKIYSTIIAFIDQ